MAPYTEPSGVRVYFINVRALPPTTASSAGKATRVTLGRPHQPQRLLTCHIK